MRRPLVYALVVSSSIALGACARTEEVPARADGSAPLGTRPDDAAPGEAFALDPAAAQKLSERLSEPERPFFSDNYVSNETSYLHVADLLDGRAASNGAYVGVGPEQTFSYVALARPRVAFVVDIRRKNAILHRVYRAAFVTTTSRVGFLAALVGREYPAPATMENATAAAIVAEVDRLPKDEATYTAVHARLRAAAGATSEADARAFDTIHRAFFDRGLDLAFELKEKNGRTYPPLRAVLTATDARRKERGFLATEEGFRFVADLERKNLVVPVVGDLAGPHAIRAIGAYLREQGLVTSVLYVSNVEPYLFDAGTMGAFAANVRALPIDPRAIVVRAYLDQGRPHPREVAGHRTVSLVQPLARFVARSESAPYRSFWELANEPVVAPP